MAQLSGDNGPVTVVSYAEPELRLVCASFSMSKQCRGDPYLVDRWRTRDGMSSRINTSRGVAIKGYDPVAYFVEGVPTPGSSEITTSWAGATWWFATVVNREAFTANPDHFAPQFGGWCSAGKALHIPMKGSPMKWRIENDQLFLQANFISYALHGMLDNRIQQLATESGNNEPDSR